jgi:acyl dehydratase
VPPTFLFCLEMESPEPGRHARVAGVGLPPHAARRAGLRYHRLAYAGDRLTFHQRIVDIYDKKGGALEFIVRKTAVSNQRGEPVAELRTVTVYRNPAP